MNIVQVTPGAGAMYCGNCLRDNALVGAWRRLGHQVLMVPLYLPLTLDEPDQSTGTPLFFGGLNVYLEEKSAWFRSAPDWLHRALRFPPLLKWTANKAGGTNPADLGPVTVSMLRGEQGNQARELDQLIAFLKAQPRPDVLCLSNALLLGMARRLKAELRTRLVCNLQGEDTFLDALSEPHRSRSWKILAERAAEVDAFIAPSLYFGQLMRSRLGFPAERLRVVYNGINLDGYDAPARRPEADRPVLGYFARMSAQKGLDTLIDAFIAICRRGAVKQLRLRVGGSCGPSDQPFVNSLKERLRSEALFDQVEFHPNLDRAAKIRFLRSLSVFSVPATYGEAFGLYVLEALAAGVPVVQPATAAFPEVVAATGGGDLCAPEGHESLAQAIEGLLLDPLAPARWASTDAAWCLSISTPGRWRARLSKRSRRAPHLPTSGPRAMVADCEPAFRYCSCAHQPASPGKIPVPPAASAQPGGLACLGRRRICRRARRE